jgi:DUF1707 SHOCT-like domain
VGRRSCEGDMSITDLDRDGVVHELRERYARGELTHGQLAELVTAALEALSRADLAAVMASGHASEREGFAPAVDATATDLARIEPQLAPDERIEWVGHPDPTKRFTRADAFLIPFSLLWGGFAFTFEAAAIAGGVVPAMLVGGVFSAIGAYMIAGRFAYKARLKRRTVYAVTNSRALTIVARRRGETVHATYLHAIPYLTTTVDSKGTGSVEFSDTANAPSARYANTGYWTYPGAGGNAFYDIHDPRAVADLIERLRTAPVTR